MTVGWDDRDPAVRQSLDDQLLNVVVPESVRSALAREPLTLDLVKEWHRRMTAIVSVAPPEAAGRFRDPSWFPHEIHVAGVLGVPTADVAAATADFEFRYDARVNALDVEIPDGSPPVNSVQVDQVLLLCAELHGDWVRIHPFGNGNGRTARLLGNWILVRYGVQPLLSPTPRPHWGMVLRQGQDRYEWAAQLSMSVGNHRMMFSELKGRYRRAYGSL